MSTATRGALFPSTPSLSSPSPAQAQTKRVCEFLGFEDLPLLPSPSASTVPATFQGFLELANRGRWREVLQLCEFVSGLSGDESDIPIWTTAARVMALLRMKSIEFAEAELAEFEMFAVQKCIQLCGNSDADCEAETQAGISEGQSNDVSTSRSYRFRSVFGRAHAQYTSSSIDNESFPSAISPSYLDTAELICSSKFPDHESELGLFALMVMWSEFPLKQKKFSLAFSRMHAVLTVLCQQCEKLIRHCSPGFESPFREDQKAEFSDSLSCELKNEALASGLWKISLSQSQRFILMLRRSVMLVMRIANVHCSSSGHDICDTLAATETLKEFGSWLREMHDESEKIDLELSEEILRLWQHLESMRGRIFLRLGNVAVAREIFESIDKSSHDQRYAFMLANRGLASFVKGEYNMAALYFEEALKIDPSSALCANNLALSHVYTADLLAAVSSLENFVRMNFSDLHPNIISNLALLYEIQTPRSSDRKLVISYLVRLYGADDFPWEVCRVDQSR